MEEELPGGSKTWRPWHRMGMILHKRWRSLGVQSAGRIVRRSIIGETGYHKSTLLLERNMVWGHPRSFRLRNHEGRPCDNNQPSWLCEAHWSLLVGKRTNQNCSIKKSSLAGVGGTDQRRKLFRRGDRLGYWNKAGLNYGRETKNGHMKTASPWKVTRSILEYRARLGFEKQSDSLQKWAEVRKSHF